MKVYFVDTADIAFPSLDFPLMGPEHATEFYYKKENADKEATRISFPPFSSHISHDSFETEYKEGMKMMDKPDVGIPTPAKA